MTNAILENVMAKSLDFWNRTFQKTNLFGTMDIGFNISWKSGLSTHSIESTSVNFVLSVQLEESNRYLNTRMTCLQQLYNGLF